MGPGPRVHLALFGRNDRVMHRVVAAANAGAAILHPAIARIFEVSRFDGVVYGVGDPSEGLDLSALLASRRPVPVELAVAVTAAVARVAVAVHDAGGPGYRGPPLGLGAVLSGGLSPDGVFLEPSGAVRLRPLAAAGTDPEVPSAFRAPEEAISMAADVYSLGRLLMALLSGDATGKAVPRLPTTSAVVALMTRLVNARASERPHLHEVVTRLEGLLREHNVNGADQAVRAALGGAYRALVVDPGLGLDAPPRVVDALRMQLAYIYPAVERLWPTMMPMHAPPPPPAFAALPPATSDEGVAVFTDARPAVRRQKAKTAATLVIGAADLAAAVASVSGEGAAFKPKTSPTLMIPTAELRKALPAPGAEQAQPRAERTMLIDPATFAPFSPPPPTMAPAAPPSPPRLDVDSERPVTPPRPARAAASSSSSSSSSSSFASSFASSPSPRRSDPVGSPPRPPTHSAMAVFADGAEDEGENDSGDSEDRTQMLGPEQGNLMERLAAKEHQDALSEAAAFARGLLEGDRDVGDVFSNDDDQQDNDDNDSGFADSPRPSVSASEVTGVAPTPFLSEPGGYTDALALEAVANAATAMAPPSLEEKPAPGFVAPLPARTRPGLPTFAPSSSEGDMDEAFAAAFAPLPPPMPSGPATHAPAMTLQDDDDAPTASRRASSAEDDPEFWMQGTLVDVGYGASQDGLFTSTYAQPLNRIRWQITEQHLIARVAYERIEDSDGKGAGRSVKDGVIAAMFRVQSHFDIIRSYNPTTGEKMNIVEENSSDRPWFERAYMRVDFSANLATNTYDFDTLAMLGVYGGVKYEPMSYWVSDPNDPDAPHFDTGNGYFDITTKAFATPQMIDLSMFDWGIDAFPACFLEADFLGGSYPGGTCNPAELTIRHAFRKVVDTDYEPSHWDGLRFQAYGPFTKDRFGFARNYGMSDDKWHRFISRYDIWERSHFYENAAAMTGAIPCNTEVTTPFGADPNRDIDKNGTSDECQVVGAGSRCDTFNQKCTLPFAQRKEVPIVWYYAEPGDPAYFEGSYWATHEWDVALRSAVVVARYAECQRTGGDDCAARFPVWHGQDDDNSDAIHLAREVDDCRAGRAYPELARDEAACAALADSLGADLGYSAGVIATAKMAEMVVLCHSPVEAGDPAACGDSRLPAGVKAADCRGPDDADVCKAARRVRRGDLRYHQVNVIQEPQSESPWGIYTDAEDPLSGQKISASINVWSSVTDRWSQNIIDMARFIGGELSADDVTDGTHVQDWARAAQAAGGGGALGVMGDKTHASPMAALGEARLPAGGVPGSAGREARSKAEVRPDIAARVADVKAQLKQVKAHVKAPSSSAPTYAARLKALAGTPLESSLLTPMMHIF